MRVNAVAPGYIETDMTSELGDEIRAEAARGARRSRGFGTPEDVAGAVAFLCSPAAAYITGVVLPVDGGLSM